MSETTTSIIAIETKTELSTGEMVGRILAILITIGIFIASMLYLYKTSKSSKKALGLLFFIIILIIQTSLTYKDMDNARLNKGHFMISAFITTIVICYIIFYLIKHYIEKNPDLIIPIPKKISDMPENI